MNEIYFNTNRSCWIEKSEAGYRAGNAGCSQSKSVFKTPEEAGNNVGLTAEEVIDCMNADPEIEE